MPKDKDDHIIVDMKGTHSPFFERSKLCMWQVMIVIEVLIYSSYSVMIHMCKVDGRIPFRSSSVVFLVEMIKLLISVNFLLVEVQKHDVHLPKLTMSFCLPFAFPAVLYFINNNIAIHAQGYMDSTTYQVLSNMKIVTTALLYRLIIKRVLKKAQWIAVGLLTLAGTLDSYGGYVSSSIITSSEVFVTAPGLMLMFVYSMLSGLSSVYSEYILKKNMEVTLHLQNILMYVYGATLNGVTWFIQTQSGDFGGLFQGFSMYTWLIVLSQVGNGLFMSVIIKYGSSMTRLFVLTSAMPVSTLLTVIFLNTQLTVYFITSVVLVVVALIQYHKH
ncbi:hypothetical protein ACJMK2_043408 [Sinanodonta woodiana]|uniref:UDP-sugar transporter protein SLC35A4 n=1 Tax=Sinanodonta woodiana TaxID=1069815 RepID=A0ABD3VWT0_SINWO